jgi:hypothetical protein
MPSIMSRSTSRFGTLSLRKQAIDAREGLTYLVIVDFILEAQMVQIRQLLRVQETLSERDCAPNELVWTDLHPGEEY